MIVHALTVSVDYATELSRGIDRWVSGLASLTVVTASRDEATITLARDSGARLHITEAFYEDGAMFNKARAMQEARALLPASDWHLFIDADVIPPVDWAVCLDAADTKLGCLHGARRVFEDGRDVGDRELAGFFQLFHSADPHAAAPLDRDWAHAGNYDSMFMWRWPNDQQRILPLDLVHIGEPGKNWCGKGNDEAMRQLREQRRTRSWRHETVRR